MFAVNVVMILLIPVSLTFLGMLWRTNPPKVMGCSYGYRSRRSMQSREAWIFVHRFMGKIWAVEGTFLSVLSLVGFLYFHQQQPEALKEAMVYIMLAQLFLMRYPSILPRPLSSSGSRSRPKSAVSKAGRHRLHRFTMEEFHETQSSKCL